MKVTDLVTQIKPFVLGWLETVAGGAGPYAPSPHELNGAHHSGTLATTQYPDALLRDGSRSLTGNLSVGAGITVDGVDISAHAADVNAHHAQQHALVGGDHTALGLTTGYVVRASGATTFAWAQLQHSDLGGVDADQHVAHSGVTITAGAGLTGGGTIAASRTLAVGAGTMITVNADDVAITAGANYQFIGTGGGTAAGWRNVSELAGNGLTHSAGVLAVGAGTLITVAADAVGITAGATYQFIGTAGGTAAAWQDVSTLAGNGLTSATGVLAVGAGTLITVAADAVGITAGATYQFIGTAGGTAAAWQNVSTLAGNGLTSATGVLAVGAGTLITVNADDVAITAGANYQFIGTGSGTAAAWQNVSTLAGNGLTSATGVLAVGAGDGIDVAADAVAVDVTDFIDTSYGLTESSNDIRVNLDADGGLEFNTGAIRVKLATNHGLSRSSAGMALGTPSTLTTATTDSVTTTTHAHAITTTSDGETNVSTILASDASGRLRLDGLGIGVAPTAQELRVDGDLIFVGAQAVSTTTGDLTLDSAGDIILDADGADWIFKDGGTEIGRFTNSSSDFILKPTVADKDLIFQEDGASEIARFDSSALALLFATSNAIQWRATTQTIYSSAVGQLDVDAATELELTAPTVQVNAATLFDVVGNMRLDGDLQFVGAQSITTTTGDLSISPAGDLALNPTGAQIRVMASHTLQSDNYASQTTGWGISYAGGADFRYAFVDELHAKSFITDLEQALAGGQIISKSVAMLSRAFTAPAASGTATLYVWDLPSAEDMAAFVSGDIVRLRTFSRAAGSLTIADCWGVVTAYSNLANKEQSWTFTRSAAPNAGAMAAGTVIAADSLALDYGTTGNGFHEVNAVDGAYGVNSPYSQVVTWATHPATGQTVRARLGNLNGITAVTEYGLYAGDGTGTSNKYLRISDQNVELRNISFYLYDGASVSVKLDYATPSFALGDDAPAGYASAEDGVWMGKDTTYKVRIGDSDGEKFQWDGAALGIYADASNYISISGNDISFYSNAAVTILLDGATGDATLGVVGAGKFNLFWDASEGDLLLRLNTSNRVALDGSADTVAIGNVSNENVYITSTAVQIRDGTTVYTELLAGELILGDDGGAQDWISISSANGVRLYGNNTLTGHWTTAGAVIIGETANSKSRVEISAGAISLITRSGAGVDATNISLSAAGVILVGQAAASQNNIQISAGAMSIRNNATERIGLTAAGILTIKDSGGAAVFTFDASVGAEFTKPLTIGTAGGIYQGTGTFASPTTGLKIWNDGGVGRIGGYNATVLQWYADTNGKLRASNVTLDETGVYINALVGYSIGNSYKVSYSGNVITAFGAYVDAGYTVNYGYVKTASIAGKGSILTLSAECPSGYEAEVSLGASDGTTTSSISLTSYDPYVVVTGTNITLVGNTYISSNLLVSEYILHTSDADTYQRYQDDHWTLRCGGVDMIDVVEDTADYIALGGELRVPDYIAHVGDTDTYQYYQPDRWTLRAGGVDMIDVVEDTADYIALGGELRVPDYIAHVGDTDTYQYYQPDRWTLRCGGVDMIDAVEDATDYLQLVPLVGIGTVPSYPLHVAGKAYVTGRLTHYQTASVDKGILISGVEYYNESYSSTDGVLLIVGVNRASNRQLWIGDSTNLGSSTNGFFRLLSGAFNSIDAVTGDGLTRLNMNVCTTDTNLSVGQNAWTVVPANKISVNGNASVGATYMNVAAPSNGMLIEGRLGVGESSPAAKVDILQSGTTAAISVVQLHQADVDQPYIDFQGGTVYTGKTAVDEYVMVKSGANTRYVKLYS